MAIPFPTSAELLARARYTTRRISRHRTSSRSLNLWRIATSPLWVSSDVPPPMLPSLRREEIALTESGAADHWLHDSLGKLSNRFWFAWIASFAIRGAAIGAVGAIVWSILASFDLVADPSIFGISIVVLGGLVPGFLVGLTVRPSTMRVARMLDRTFQLDERLATALEPPVTNDPEVIRMQRADAANALYAIRPEIRLAQFLPVREVVLLMVSITASLSIWMFAFDTHTVDDVAVFRVPGYYSASERLADQQAPLPQPSQQQSSTSTTETEKTGEETTESNQTLDDLRALAAAFQNHESTASVADLIATGNLKGAADALESSSVDIASASQEERDALADDLEAAASNISDPELKEKVEAAADKIREGGSGAQEAIQDLAQTLDQMAPEQGEQTGNSTGETGSSGSSEPVGEQTDQGQTSGQNSQDGDSTTGTTSESDPGAGADAQPGLAENEVDGGQTSGGDQPGGEEGEGETSGQSEGDAAGESESDESGNQDQSDGTTSDNATSEEGNGASSGNDDSEETGEVPDTGEFGDTNPEEDPEESADEPETAPVGEEGNEGNASGGSETIVIGGASDENIQSGNDTGSSSLGSGATGAEVGSGSAEDQYVGSSGPDSNHVDEEYEDVVEDYFEEGGGS